MGRPAQTSSYPVSSFSLCLIGKRSDDTEWLMILLWLSHIVESEGDTGVFTQRKWISNESVVLLLWLPWICLQKPSVGSGAKKTPPVSLALCALCMYYLVIVLLGTNDCWNMHHVSTIQTEIIKTSEWDVGLNITGMFRRNLKMPCGVFLSTNNRLHSVFLRAHCLWGLTNTLQHMHFISHKITVNWQNNWGHGCVLPCANKQTLLHCWMVRNSAGYL